MKNNNTTYEAFTQYMDFAKDVVGRIKWRNSVKQCHRVCDFVTISDEALALLALDNYEYVWEAMALKFSSVPFTKYTSPSAQRRTCDGWSITGQKKFNEYYDIVEVNRNSEQRTKLEQQYLAVCQGTMSIGGTSKMVYQSNVVTKDDLGSYNCSLSVGVPV